MKLIKKRKKKKIIFLKLVSLAFVGYVVFNFVGQQIQLNQKKAELEEKNKAIAVQNIKNEEMLNVVNSTEEGNQEYIEQIARENLDFAKEGERVFVNISGN